MAAPDGSLGSTPGTWFRSALDISSGNLSVTFPDPTFPRAVIPCPQTGNSGAIIRTPNRSNWGVRRASTGFAVASGAPSRPEMFRKKQLSIRFPDTLLPLGRTDRKSVV